MGQLLVLYLSEDQGMSLSHSAAYSSAVFAASILGKVLPLTSHLLHLTLPLTPYSLRCTSHTVTSHTGQVGCGCGLDGPHAKWVGMAGTRSLALRSLRLLHPTPRVSLTNHTPCVLHLTGCALLLCGSLLVLQLERAPSGDTAHSGGSWRIAPVSSEAQLAAFVITYGLGYGASFALVQSHAAQAYGRREGFGRLQGALVLAQYVGGFGGVTLTALLRERTQSYLAPFALFPVLALIMCGHCYFISWGGSRCGRSSGE